ncbi:SDR family NAD(P)-dependent oxidoreductase [Paenibacillus sinopodophylli]|uniref:SDR family NAD(P)-dependent oxidoreductase n=1 Tax=Paenibacillus sinopodophylli TaxID=1837342 RepID=UPI00110CBFF2|nr:SDR family NAD(P)-dependent oxidoreductase [Paenibacillus sinopodophylli]
MNNLHKDHIALITGANNGIGLELTRRLLQEDCQVIALIRSAFPEDDPHLRESIASGKLRIYKADLSDFASLRQALDTIKEKEQKIDLLFNNAGGSMNELQFTKQGRELHFDLQTVAPYIVLMELKELLLKGSPKTVINTSSHAFMFRKQFDPDTLERPAKFTKLYGPYAASKLALSLWSLELAPKLASEGIRLLSVDPGGNNTIRKGKSSGIPFYLKPIIKLFFPHPSKGAELLYNGAAHGKAGDFLVKGQKTKLMFAEQSHKVLAKVSAIYKQEFRTS